MGSKSHSASQQEAVDLVKFLHLAAPETCKIENVTSMNNVVRYLNHLRECGVASSGQSTKLTVLQDAMISRLPDNGETKDLVVRAKVVETKLKGISKSLQKESSIICLQKWEMFDGGSKERHRVLNFLENRQLKELIQGYLEKSSV